MRAILLLLDTVGLSGHPDFQHGVDIVGPDDNLILGLAGMLLFHGEIFGQHRLGNRLAIGVVGHLRDFRGIGIGSPDVQLVAVADQDLGTLAVLKLDPLAPRKFLGLEIPFLPGAFLGIVDGVFVDHLEGTAGRGELLYHLEGAGKAGNPGLLIQLRLRNRIVLDELGGNESVHLMGQKDQGHFVRGDFDMFAVGHFELLFGLPV